MNKTTNFHKMESNISPLYPYFPFINEEEWSMAEFLATSCLSKGSIDTFLKTAWVCELHYHTILATNRLSRLRNKSQPLKLQTNSFTGLINSFLRVQNGNAQRLCYKRLLESHSCSFMVIQLNAWSSLHKVQPLIGIKCIAQSNTSVMLKDRTGFSVKLILVMHGIITKVSLVQKR